MLIIVPVVISVVIITIAIRMITIVLSMVLSRARTTSLSAATTVSSILLHYLISG